MLNDDEIAYFVEMLFGKQSKKTDKERRRG